MSKVLVFGHKNPDTDTICSALVASYIFKDKLEIEPVCLGELNDETKFVLDYLNIDSPRIIDSVNDNQDVMLVDHNEFNQSVNNIENANIIHVIDHHRVDNFNTQSPLYMDLAPVGCTATILYDLAQRENVEITKEIATLMISAIISDTLLFKSPTCTQKDIDTAEQLSLIAAINLEEYGLNVLKAGTDLSKFDAKHLLSIDAKEFDTQNGKFNVAQITTLDIEELMNQFRDDLHKEISKQNSTNGYDLSILLVTDILECNSLAIVIGDKTKYFEEKFNVILNNNEVILNDVVSRKKQIVPFL